MTLDKKVYVGDIGGVELEPIDEFIKVENFFSKLRNLEIVNNFSQKVPIVLRRPRFRFVSEVPSSNEYLFEFVGYPGYLERIALRNFLWFHVDYSKRRIVAEYAQIVHPDLKSHKPSVGFFSSFIRGFGGNFPDGFEYYAEIDNKRSKADFLKIREEFIQFKINKEKAEAKLRECYQIREIIASGFNVVKVNFGKDQFVFFQASKGTNPELVFEVDFDL